MTTNTQTPYLVSQEKRSAGSMLSRMSAVLPDPETRVRNADLLAVFVAAVLPWSTSAVGIGIGLWLIALVPTIDPRKLLGFLKDPICVLPISLFVLAVVATSWSEAPTWSARFGAVNPTAKLLVLPLLLYHFRRSPRGMWVFIAFLVSCTAMTIMSWIVTFYPSLSQRVADPERGVFVKNYIDQAQEFALCATVLVYPIVTFVRSRKFIPAMLLGAMALSFVVNMAFVIVSRTALVTMPLMLVIFALLHLRWRLVAQVMGGIVVLACVIWLVSPQLRTTTSTFASDYEHYRASNQATSIGLRLEYLQKSIRFFAEAPVIGHGTGSIRRLFEQAATGPEASATANVVSNPHNQTLNIAIQWGLVGVVLLYAMWLFHLMLFRGDGLVASIGLLVVLQNILTSFFNSHLFDFHEGWMYVLGVGVAGGMILQARAATTAAYFEDKA